MDNDEWPQPFLSCPLLDQWLRVDGLGSVVVGQWLWSSGYGTVVGNGFCYASLKPGKGREKCRRPTLSGDLKLSRFKSINKASFFLNLVRTPTHRQPPASRVHKRCLCVCVCVCVRVCVCVCACGSQVPG